MNTHIIKRILPLPRIYHIKCRVKISYFVTEITKLEPIFNDSFKDSGVQK